MICHSNVRIKNLVRLNVVKYLHAYTSNIVQYMIDLYYKSVIIIINNVCFIVVRIRKTHYVFLYISTCFPT